MYTPRQRLYANVPPSSWGDKIWCSNRESKQKKNAHTFSALMLFHPDDSFFGDSNKICSDSNSLSPSLSLFHALSPHCSSETFFIPLLWIDADMVIWCAFIRISFSSSLLSYNYCAIMWRRITNHFEGLWFIIIHSVVNRLSFSHSL